ncbi:MAG: cytochrome c [Anaerolineae bacterium]|nr:cytochrome c [Anaerolineae bacterium]
MKRFQAILWIVVLLVSLTFVWVAAAQDTGTDDADSMDMVLVERGAGLFLQTGCVGCHGIDGVGTDIAPTLAGHSSFQVRRQVRAPIGIMPVFSPAQVSAEDLDAIVAYVSSLGTMDDMEGMAEEEDDHADAEHADAETIEVVDAHSGEHGGLRVHDVNFAHHWLLWLALQADDTEMAIHQTAHILELVEAGHLAVMQGAFDLVISGDLEGASAIVESTVTDVGDFSDDPGTIALQITYEAAVTDNADIALHFIIDYSENYATDETREFSDNVMAHIESGELQDAAMLLADYLGDDRSFTGGNLDMDGDSDHDDGSDDHDDGDSDEEHED